jgi:hypothetical protein
MNKQDEIIEIWETDGNAPFRKSVKLVAVIRNSEFYFVDERFATKKYHRPHEEFEFIYGETNN